jgi:hypothetical protein
LNTSHQRIARAVEMSSFSILRRQEELKGFRERSRKATRFFRSGQVGEGERALPRSLVDSLCSVHADQMARFGYGPPNL